MIRLKPSILITSALVNPSSLAPITDKGLNKITITVDADNTVNELFETNNSITKEFFIFEDEARPVYPYNYSIVNTQGIKFHVSTANPFSTQRDYTMEIDTTELFNSTLKVVRTVNSKGGVITFDPGLVFTDSTVYYWRVSPAPTSGSRVWNTASFIYLPNSEFGFNQSFNQHHQVIVHEVDIHFTRMNRFLAYIMYHPVIERIFLTKIRKAVDDLFRVITVIWKDQLDRIVFAQVR